MDLTNRPTQFAPKRKNTRTIIIIVLSILAVCLIAMAGIVIGIAIPAWQSAVRSGNETTAVQTIQTIRILQAQFASRNKGKFAPSFDELIKTGELDEKFAGQNPVVNGYVFTMKVEEPSAAQPAFYSINADPQITEGRSATGTGHFYINSSLGTIKATEENRPARADDPSI